MPKRRKKKRTFTATKAVKSMARTAIGAPPPVKRVEDRRQPGKPKHKATLRKLLTDSEAG